MNNPNFQQLLQIQSRLSQLKTELGQMCLAYLTAP